MSFRFIQNWYPAANFSPQIWPIDCSTVDLSPASVEVVTPVTGQICTSATISLPAAGQRRGCYSGDHSNIIRRSYISDCQNKPVSYVYGDRTNITCI